MNRARPQSSRGRSWRYLLIALLVLAGLACAVYAALYRLARDGSLDRVVSLVASPTIPPMATIGSGVKATILPSIMAVSPTAETLPTPERASLIVTATPSAQPGSAEDTPEAATPGATSTATTVPTIAPTHIPPPPTATPLPPNRFAVESPGCIPHGSGRGTVKGQVFDRDGRVIVGAQVYVTLDDWEYDRPAISNPEGWYEFYLDNGLRVRIVKLVINDEEMTLVDAEREFEARAGCFEHVNLRRQ